MVAQHDNPAQLNNDAEIVGIDDVSIQEKDRFKRIMLDLIRTDAELQQALVDGAEEAPDQPIARAG